MNEQEEVRWVMGLRGCVGGAGSHERLDPDCIECWKFQAMAWYESGRQQAKELVERMRHDPVTVANIYDERGIASELGKMPIQNTTLLDVLKAVKGKRRVIKIGELAGISIYRDAEEGEVLDL